MTTAYYQSPFGCFKIEGSEKGITTCQLQQGMDCYGAEIPDELAEVVLQLDEYFNRKRTEFDVKLDFSAGTEFNQSVWRELLKIPYGRTTSYSAIAKTLDIAGISSKAHLWRATEYRTQQTR